MEHILRCNTLKCRQELGDQALVTTCSHCFCVECANQFQLLSRQNGQYPACPACQMHLSNPDDAVLATLNPTEDYKTSVLSGLSPNTIIECAGRAMSFWAYQTTQEM
ncbi:E3 ubiquitin-protein ligase CCNB1IP1 [Golovinomyces cichoracearum]|uniref:E3 ubiquitin-protein ligase CCNB1IP1 n=1 Tax=Golovinomyces cichoracearum TaxID=62708 RepID=A0A420IUE4_9PEZI|nr:E3 ubiquitin-protein ligase CCNB1IP1 [Golovinomyces cichoracearum]